MTPADPAARPPRRALGALLAAVLLALAPSGARAQAAPEGAVVTVFAAASLQEALEGALDALAAPLAREGLARPRVSYGASSALARQVEAGAPADLFASADEDWADYLAGRNLLRAGSRVSLLGNRLVLVAPRDGPAPAALPIEAGALLAALGPDGRLAVAETGAVPAGRYARAALERLGAWGALRPRLAEGESVRAALLLVARGEAPLGAVYATDAAAEPRVRVVAAFPEGSHPPVTYPFAVTAGARGEGAARLLALLRSDAARRAFEARGFAVLSPRTGS